ncbi:MAG TPA: spermidine/putrescine ABC transporter substrate-binding protein [Candidatus Limnocylindrales bacterium]|nr:spermidine/putrescine ABC transporter substrate-binding protein [Candidatus Limnocylindrales bacterium]
MSDRPDPAAFAEEELFRYLADRRMTRREMLRRVTALGAAVALAPVVAACNAAASAAPSAAPSQAASPSSAAASVAAASPSAAPTAPPTPAPSPESALYIYNWDGYIGDHTVSDFEKQYGIKVKYDKFPDADTQMTKLRSDGKGGGYDVSYPASTEMPALIKDGVVLKLDQTLIPNAANLRPEWKNPAYDPGNQYSMPNYWWTTGFAWDPDKIKDSLADWTALWDDRFKGHMGMLDDQREVFAVAGFRLGLNPNTTSDADLDQMLQLLEQQKPLLRKYTDDDIGDVTSGDLWISHAWSGDWYQMTADKPKTQYVVPASGAVRGNDTLVVLSGAPHPIAAHLWLNFNLDAKVSAANTNFIGYMGPNAAAEQYIDPAIKGDERLNPPQSVLDKLVELLYLAPADLDKYTQRWNALRA